ncbi:uncharacterized protein LOC131651319 [Vicia villosa]|uniref:uncharacterized protein LOC131651319 n=1 Tax=Vicia villosa TaxID=3911 RepID=UPI00273B90E3|nr:uncharacterized protein LOC131651319 [Vicia villosa]
MYREIVYGLNLGNGGAVSGSLLNDASCMGLITYGLWQVVFFYSDTIGSVGWFLKHNKALFPPLVEFKFPKLFTSSLIAHLDEPQHQLKISQKIEVETIYRNFMWCGKEGNSNKALVAWDSVCNPKITGGLDVISLREWNISTMGKLFWNIQSKSDKLWVKWINMYYMKNQTAMDRNQHRGSWIPSSIIKIHDIIHGTSFNERSTVAVWNTGLCLMIIAWNVRGFNNAGKLREVSSRLRTMRPMITILLETRVKENKANDIKQNLHLGGMFVDNYANHSNGRIWINWNNNRIDVHVIKSSSQMIHCGLFDLAGNFLSWLTAIYAANDINQRRILWRDIEGIHNSQQGSWMLIGDFNNVTRVQDRIGGKRVTQAEVQDLLSMMEVTDLCEMDGIGAPFTWSNKQMETTIYSKIDKVLANTSWFQQHLDTTLHILHPGTHVHCIGETKEATEGNEKHVQTPKYFESITRARDRLDEAHHHLEQDLMNRDRIHKVQVYTTELLTLTELEEKVLKQKSKIDWLKLGDGNNSYFHASLKSKQAAKGMQILYKEDDTLLTTQEEIEHAVVSYYESLMGTATRNISHVDISVMRNGPQLTMEQRQSLELPISEQEIETALKGIGDSKAPGIDGFGAKFFKASWQTVKHDVMGDVRDFFENERMYKAVNCIVVTLIPKSDASRTIKDYIPIAGCTTLYKIISRIITARLARVIGSVINHSQAAFIPRQQIHNHILLTYELLRGYARKGGTPNCMLQLDLQKAYDMVDWNALEIIMKEIGLPMQFVRWIMLTVQTVSYRFNVNGVYTKVMPARRGIRQGDPLSPMLFRGVQICGDDASSATEIFVSTGLIVNPRKCRVYFGGVDNDTRNRILELTTFQEGDLPFRYLGIPMTSKRLEIHQYMPLDDKIVARITHWSSRLLSYAGKIQLVKRGATIKKKSPVAWKSVCKPRKYGGLNIIDLQIWNNIAMLKLL